MKGSRVLTIAAVAAGILLGSFALEGYAQGKGGGGGLAGTVYFTYQGGIWSMTPEGTNKTLLGSQLHIVGSSPFVSNGMRWSLQLRTVQSNHFPPPYPNARSWHTDLREIFAVREDGYAVQLTNNPRVQLIPNEEDFRWNFDAARGLAGGLLSWVARTWNEELTEVVAGGVYTAQIFFDADGNVAELGSQPLVPALPRPLSVGGGDPYPRPVIFGHQFSPNGLELLFGANAKLYIVPMSTGAVRFLTDGGIQISSGYTGPWSPDGGLIAFSGSLARVYVIKPDGKGKKTVAQASAGQQVWFGGWSPGGSHLLYHRWDGNTPGEIDIYRVTNSGTGNTNLTGDIGGHLGGHPRSLIWRQ